MVSDIGRSEAPHRHNVGRLKSVGFSQIQVTLRRASLEINTPSDGERPEGVGCVTESDLILDRLVAYIDAFRYDAFY